MMAKFTREWKGKVRVQRCTRGDGTFFFFMASYRSEGVWMIVKGYTPASGSHNQVVTEFPDAVAAMNEAQRVWSACHAKAIVKTEKVF